MTDRSGSRSGRYGRLPGLLGEDRVEVGEHVGEGTGPEAGMDGADPAVLADDVHARDGADAIRLGDPFARVEQQVQLPACLLRILAHPFYRRRVIVPEIDGQDGDLVPAKVLLELLQIRQLIAARGAPGRPEGYDGDLSLLGREADPFPVDVVACGEVRRPDTHLGSTVRVGITQRSRESQCARDEQACAGRRQYTGEHFLRSGEP